MPRSEMRRKYSKLDHEVKKITKLDKRKFVEILAVVAEEAAGREDLKTIYRINKVLETTMSM